MNGQCLVVMYHYVRPRSELDDRGVRGITAEEFAAQIDRLTRDLQPIDWPTLRQGLAGEVALPVRSFLLTFDDGLRDHVDAVLPILGRRGLRGLFFVSGRAIDERQMLDAHAIHLLLTALPDEKLKDELLRSLTEIVPCADWWAKVNQSAAVKRWHYERPLRAMLKHFLMITLPAELRRCVLEALFEHHVGSAAQWADRWYLTWNDVHEMRSAGHVVGAHGYTHEPLATLAPDAKRQELARTFALLHQKLGGGPQPLSYPYGSFDADTQAACREVGFTHAFTTQRSWLTTSSDPLALPRVDTIDVATFLEKATV